MKKLGKLTKKLKTDQFHLPYQNFTYQRVFLALLFFLWFVPLLQGTEATSPEKDFRQMLSWHIIKSKDKRIIVIGPDGRYNTLALKWVEDIRKRFEKLTGIKLSLNSSEIHISVRPQNQQTPAKTKVGNEISPAQSSVVSWIERYNEYVSMRVVLLGYEDIDPQKVNTTLCSLLIYTSAIEQTNVHHSASFTPTNIPSWLVKGIVRNLYPEQKVENINVGLKYWYEGKMPFPEELLTETPSNPSPLPRVDLPLFHEYVSGLFVAWLASFQQKKEIFGNIFKRLVQQKPLSIDWLTTCIPECTKHTDLAMAWDKWVFSQKYVVCELGTASMFHVEELCNLLLIRPNEIGDSSITNKQFMSLRELIPVSKQYNLKDFCSIKITALKVLSAGRGKEFENVVDLYCQFLAELSRGNKAERLVTLLDKADQALNAFTETLKNKQKNQ